MIQIPSIQTDAHGNPRFHVALPDGHPNRAELEAAEQAGGVQAEVRAFLDEQIETGDVVLDLDPSIGFVALGAATAPKGAPAVFVTGLPIETVQRLQDAAADAGAWIEELEIQDPDEACATIDARLEPEGRVFIHAASARIGWMASALEPLLMAGRIVAVCISDASTDPDWTATAQHLRARGLVPHELAAKEDEIVLLPVDGAPSGAVIAIALDSTHATGQDTVSEAADLSGGPVKAAAFTSTPMPTDTNRRWVAERDGFSLIAPHSRTGYGVAAAHLLRSLQRREVPVAFFPIGPVDGSLADNPRLREALVLQEAYRPDVPSVRLSQQFDLALHAGRGPRIGFTIFELDRFTPSELHHMRQQDALISCSAWARTIIRANGITDIPVHVVPLGVNRAVFHEGVASSSRPGDTVFLQVGKLEPRKGQRELLRAFEAAFTPKDLVRLVLVCSNPFISRSDFDAMLAPFRQSPMASRITLLTQEVPTQQEIATLMAGADCGVFAARAEGWNLEALEMLSMGKAVIATDYSAHTEFLTADNSRLIAIDGLETAAGSRIGEWAAWGGRQHDQLVTHLREVHAARREGQLGPNQAGVATAIRFSWDHAAEALLQALQHVA